MLTLEPGSAIPFANTPRVDDEQDAPLFFAAYKSPKSVALPVDATVINSILLVLGEPGERVPPANIPLPLPPRNSVGPLGIFIQPVELTVETPAIIGPC